MSQNLNLFDSLQRNFLGDSGAFDKLEMILIHHANAVDEKSKFIYDGLPETLSFNISRYQRVLDVIEEYSYFPNDVLSISKVIDLAMQYYAEPSEIGERVIETLQLASEGREKEILGILSGLLGSPMADSFIKRGIEKISSVVVLLLEDLIAAMVSNQIPKVNMISAPYKFDSMVGNVIVLRKTTEFF